MKNISKKNGIATLPIMMVLGMITLAVVVSISSVALNELLISQGAYQSASALSYAEGGARDALIRITRNKNYLCATMDCYSLDFATNGCVEGTGCAFVTVSGTGTIADPKIITSKGKVKSIVRKMQVTVTLDGGTTDPALQNGLITSTTWTELTN
ncbi:MAG: hypothetical protein WCI93_01005 [bacterium]